MLNIEDIKLQIAKQLQPLDLDKVILFGSYAYGTPTEDSDIDIYVVTKDDFIPKSFKEKSMIHLKVARAMKDILTKYPTDLLTHTRAMHKKFKELDSTFSQEILTKGTVIL